MSGPHDGTQSKVTRLADLPRSIEPARDLWPQIEARIRETQAVAPMATGAHPIPPRLRRARLSWLAAAAMVACVAVGVWIGRSSLPGVAPAGVAPPVARSTEGGLAASSPPGLAAATDATALDAAYVSDPRYQRQRAALLRSLPARLAALPPPARAKVLASLATIRKAKEDLESALGKDPSNALLQELLVDTYQDEMRVLTDVREASDSGRGI
jgi:hypothetical protein